MTGGVLAWPHGVGRVELEYDVNGRVVTTGSWFLRPTTIPADASTAELIADDFYIKCAGQLALLMSKAAELTACSVTISSLEYAHWRVQVERLPGAWTGAQALNVACGLHFFGSARGRGSQSVMRLPACPDDFIDSNWRISEIGYANLRDHGTEYLNRFNTVTDGGTGTLIHGTLHQRRAGAPLIPPTFDITVGVVPAARVMTIRRRLPQGRQVQP